MNKAQICLNCEFYDLTDFSTNPLPSSSGMCRRFPNSIRVNEDDWCGEYGSTYEKEKDILPIYREIRKPKTYCPRCLAEIPENK